MQKYIYLHAFILNINLFVSQGFVDFYPNGGEIQPGCSDLDTSIWNFLLLPRSSKNLIT